MGNYCYIAVCSAALGALVPTGGGEGRGHIVAAAGLQVVVIFVVVLIIKFRAVLCFQCVVGRTVD